MIANWHGTEIPENEWAFSNEDFDSTHFKPHGSVVLWPHENIVRFEVSGPFNLEFIKSIAVLVGKVYSELAEKGPFVDVVVLKNSMLMSNEAVKEICNFFQESKTRGFAPEATAWVMEAPPSRFTWPFRFLGGHRKPRRPPSDIGEFHPVTALCRHSGHSGRS